MFQNLTFRYLYSLLRIGVVAVITKLFDNTLRVHTADVAGFTAGLIRFFFSGIVNFFQGIFGHQQEDHYASEQHTQAAA